MKKENIWYNIRFLLLEFMIFFALCAFIVTVSFLTFFHYIDLDEGQVRAAAPFTFGIIVLMTIIFVAADFTRRKIMIHRPVKKIQDALEDIKSGDFTVRLDPAGSHDFAVIMESINHMTKELAGVETLRTDFIANVSHEMKTPLAVMRNYGTLLQAPDLTDEMRMEYAKIITDSSRRLADLMTNILKLNRLENQQIFSKAKVYDLGEQLCECFLQYESVWERENIEIETDIEENILIRADDELLALVWNNLLSNAFKFTESGGTVKITLEADKDYAMVSVSDTGCGISPEVGVHIFEKFYQGDTSHATQGNGLGLALVKRIIDIMNGEISVKSTLGVGSTFTVKLRRCKDGEV